MFQKMDPAVRTRRILDIFFEEVLAGEILQKREKVNFRNDQVETLIV